ncbi:hydroxyacid dehydrogenase [Cytobacillus oceanisediminis]|uniref:hydroxyacid dehydrogenase n=1 Tax=Cytobacillus oceanisediminis TaxID=665099 RepID=UPI001FB36771|nr:hydroxyacid dehydrogenase [Cytobacillus oceanisediminis]UOE53298.1 hydroxyacid dehydrogenase [Cytobacillus oceanisediminis]
MGRPRVLQILPMYHSEGEKILREGADVIQTDNYSLDHLCEMVKGVDGIVLRAPARITKEVIDANPNLKVISGAGVGLDNIDVDYASQKGIPVLHAPSVNKVSTAEHAVMLVMALAKSVIPLHEKMRQGDYNSRNYLIPLELKGKKAGLIGFGNIAQEVAKRLKLGFEMDVTAWVREYNPDKHGLAEKLGIRIHTNMKEVFEESDFVSLHIPLNESTRHSIDHKLFSIMKPSAYLINTARGAVINQHDLYESLRDGRIAGAGLDVFDPEPPSKDLPLLSLPNVVLTPHVGGTTAECNFITSATVAKNVINVLNGKRPEYIANPEVLISKILE